MNEPSSCELHHLVWGLPRNAWPFSRTSLPPNAIYFVFESGEFAVYCGRSKQRIVRVGSHRADRRFPGRMRDHYGPLNKLGGNKNSSVFRKHLGGALIRRRDPDDPLQQEWLKQGASSAREIEEAVSRYMRDRMTFTFIEVTLGEERVRLESALIATLAQDPIAPPSPSWLGRHAADPIVRATGLWNTQHVLSPRLTAREFVRLRFLAGMDARSGELQDRGA